MPKPHIAKGSASAFPSSPPRSPNSDIDDNDDQNNDNELKKLLGTTSNPDDDENKNNLQAYLVCLSIALVQMFVFGASVSYPVYLNHISEDASMDFPTQTTLSFAQTIFLIANIPFGIIAGVIMDKFGSRFVLAAGGVFTALSGIVPSYAPSTPFLLVFYGLLIGAATSCVNSPGPSTVGHFFTKDKVSWAIGLTISGSAIGISTIPLVTSTLLSYLDGDWRLTMRYMSCLGAIPTVACLLFIPNKKDESMILEENHERNIRQSLAATATIRAMSLPPKSPLRIPPTPSSNATGGGKHDGEPNSGTTNKSAGNAFSSTYTSGKNRRTVSGYSNNNAGGLFNAAAAGGHALDRPTNTGSSSINSDPVIPPSAKGHSRNNTYGTAATGSSTNATPTSNTYNRNDSPSIVHNHAHTAGSRVKKTVKLLAFPDDPEERFMVHYTKRISESLQRSLGAHGENAAATLATLSGTLAAHRPQSPHRVSTATPTLVKRTETPFTVAPSSHHSMKSSVKSLRLVSSSSSICGRCCKKLCGCCGGADGDDHDDDESDYQNYLDGQDARPRGACSYFTSTSFIICSFCMFCFGYAFFGFNFVGIPFAKSMGSNETSAYANEPKISPEAASSTFTFYGIAQAVGALSLGALATKIGDSRVIAIFFFLGATGLALLAYVARLYYQLCIVYCFIGLLGASALVCLPSLIVHCFSHDENARKNLGTIMSGSFAAFSTGGSIAPFMFSFLKEHSADGSYEHSFLVASVMLFVAFVVIIGYFEFYLHIDVIDEEDLLEGIRDLDGFYDENGAFVGEFEDNEDDGEGDNDDNDRGFTPPNGDASPGTTTPNTHQHQTTVVPKNYSLATGGSSTGDLVSATPNV